MLLGLDEVAQNAGLRGGPGLKEAPGLSEDGLISTVRRILAHRIERGRELDTCRGTRCRSLGDSRISRHVQASTCRACAACTDARKQAGLRQAAERPRRRGRDGVGLGPCFQGRGFLFINETCTTDCTDDLAASLYRQLDLSSVKISPWPTARRYGPLSQCMSKVNPTHVEWLFHGTPWLKLDNSPGNSNIALPSLQAQRSDRAAPYIESLELCLPAT